MTGLAIVSFLLLVAVTIALLVYLVGDDKPNIKAIVLIPLMVLLFTFLGVFVFSAMNTPTMCDSHEQLVPASEDQLVCIPSNEVVEFLKEMK